MSDPICVDLHCHSSFSDGNLSPEQVADELASAGVVCAALTDHNTLAGQARFRLALQRCGIEFISGVELDIAVTGEVFTPRGGVHLLAYGFDLQDESLGLILQAITDPFWASLRHRLGRVWPFGGRRGPRPTNGHPRPDPARCAAAVRANRGQVPLALALECIHQAGGRAFLAHPLTSFTTWEQLKDFLAWAQPLGLDGLEVFYKPYPPETRRALLDLAGCYNLLVSAGSDFHGPYFSGGAWPGCKLPAEHWDRFCQAVQYA